ncbi:glycosyltransferase [Gorillibacterium massiliense]|uniref:glycosyltransferase n=1 Tax=Gorillibacterium massiliense TaxID=1280390 RepID=UPI00138E548E|nr:glycosyltransferase [Gorillibacterium massiliense]
MKGEFSDKRKSGGYLPDILRQLDFVPDFIYFDDFESVRGVYGIPSGLNEINIPKGILFHDVFRVRDEFRDFVIENQFDLVFAHYRDSFLRYFPEFQDRFRWLPNHVYPKVFHNYQLEKTIDYLMMGKVNFKYPLRKKILRAMADMEGFVTHDHPGYTWFSKEQAQSSYLDEQYAMEISRAKMFLTCGSRYHFAVGKFFEVPACGTLLLADYFPELIDLGFVDKHTYVHIHKKNFLDEAKYYLEHEDEREEISRNGYNLVHSRHTTEIRVKEFVDELWRFTGKTR